MTRRIILTTATLLMAGFASATMSRRAVEIRHADELRLDWQIGGRAPTVVLQSSQLGVAPIDKEARDVALVTGVIGRQLARNSQFLPVSAPPPTWVSARSRIVGPFLVIVDTDGATRVGTSARTRHERTLDIALFGHSWSVSSWATGGLFCGLREPANTPLQPTATAPPRS